MKLEQRMLTPFVKAKYLSEPNFRRYTSIIHYLYQQHEYYYGPPALPSDIYNHIVENDSLQLFENYTEKQLDEDLKQLEEWGNVVSHADNARVSKIQDYNRSRLRYQCSDETIEIERMLEKLDGQIHRIKGSLDSKMVSSLAALVLQFQKMEFQAPLTKEERAEFHELWTEIINRFKTLREEASDYLGIIQSRNIEEAMENKDISAFRVKFTNYLTDFIIALQNNTLVIEYALKDIQDKGLVDRATQELIIYQKDKPNLEEEIKDEEMAEIYQMQWRGIQKWFVEDEYGERYVDYLLTQTNETISKFMKFLEQLTEREQQMKSKKHEFLHLAKLFEEEANFDHCLKMFGAITNIERPPHFFSERNQEIYADETIIEQGSEIKPLQNVKTVGIRKKKQIAVIEPSAEDKQLLENLRRQKAYEEQQLEEFTQRGRVALGEVEEIENFILYAILDWISKANSTTEKRGKTDNGVNYHIAKNSDQMVSVHTTEGTLTVDDYVIHFEV
ncbi:TIGR02677 family protein [Virgibacillus sp. NKC19-16]|uniref:TIGR02677 family protein n=1 Tax=Virgibacillus salidurans TaxID=2831673 RepID=UPI001F3D327F|nr:TIGR02677 family protein [Virgibacillus sp. NKC19-16]UJL46719.1 TIGR02677 family protein [Virgibacillus sp. NKC19-16]